MPMSDNIGGGYRQVAKSYDNIAGAWREGSKVFDNVAGAWRESYSGGAVVTNITYGWNDDGGRYRYTGSGSPITTNPNGIHIEFPWYFSGSGSGSSETHGAYVIIFTVPIGNTFMLGTDQPIFSISPFACGSASGANPEIYLCGTSAVGFGVGTDVLYFQILSDHISINCPGGNRSWSTSVTTDTVYLKLIMKWSLTHTNSHSGNVSLNIPNEAIHILPASENIPVIFS